MPGTRLSQFERCRIEAMWVAGLPCPQIAAELGRDRSTVWREVRRNHSQTHGSKHGGRAKGNLLRHAQRPAKGLYRWGYDAAKAQARADTRARRPRQVKLGYHLASPGRPRGGGWGKGYARGVPTALRRIVVGRLAKRWSPEQISAWLATEYAGYPELQVSHETIYQGLYVKSRGNLRAELPKQVALRRGRVRRRRRAEAAGAVRSSRSWAAGFNISTRPAEVQERTVPGHWEGDIVIGVQGRSAIVTLVERKSRYVLLGHLSAQRDGNAVIAILCSLAQRLPKHLMRSLTWDCGTEMADHATFTLTTGCPVYFADPHSPWQRGLNENTNGLLRQYFPKGVTDFRSLTQHDLDTVAHEMNTRPRQVLAWQTPRQVLNRALVATAA